MQSEVKAPNLANENDVSLVRDVDLKPDLVPKAAPWFQRWGSASQIASALISFATLSAAIYGLSAASPFFKNKLLTEANARLEVETTALAKSIAEQTIALERMAADVRMLRRQGWDLQCANVAQSISNGLSIFTANRDFDRTVRLAVDHMTFRLGVKDAIDHADFSALADSDLSAFKEFAATYVKLLPPEYDTAFKMAVDGEKGKLGPAQQSHRFLDECVAEGAERLK